MTDKIPPRLTWAVEQLPAHLSGHLLEVGCGGGHVVALLSAQHDSLRVTAIDRSAIQVQRARERNGRARIEQVSLADAPATFGGSQFDAILAVNVNAFWTNPRESLAAARHLLKRDGAIFLVYEPPSPSQLARIRESMSRLFVENGFAVVDVRTASFGKSSVICIIGKLPRDDGDRRARS